MSEEIPTKGGPQRIERDYHRQRALREMLQASLHPAPLREQLEAVLRIVLTLPWLKLQAQGCVYLARNEQQVLLAEVTLGVPSTVIESCAEVPFGRCLCGRAAVDRRVVHSSCVDERHEVCASHMPPHGHYCVPIISAGQLLGVLTLYQTEGQQFDGEHSAFLSAVADTLAGIIERKLAEQALVKARIDLEQQVASRTASLAQTVSELEQEVVERRNAEARLTASLEEKQLLLREIHHRVKNNMQVICSMLDLQAFQLTDPSQRVLFAEAQSRIRAMALLHEHLYRSRNLGQIDFGEYVTRLVNTLLSSHGNAIAKIATAISAQGIALDIDTAIPCGLVINELVTNALKHAFEGQDSGRITVGAHRRAHLVELTVADDGIGLSTEGDVVPGGSFGLQLVRTLVEHQLCGKVERLPRDHGTAYRVRFPAGRSEAIVQTHGRLSPAG